MAHNDGFLDAVCLNEAEADDFSRRWYDQGFEDAMAGCAPAPKEEVDLYGIYDAGYNAGYIARWTRKDTAV